MDLKSWMCEEFGDDDGDISLLVVLMVVGAAICVVAVVASYLYGGYALYHAYHNPALHEPSGSLMVVGISELIFGVTSTLLIAGGVVFGVPRLLKYIVNKCDSIKVVRCKEDK